MLQPILRNPALFESKWLGKLPLLMSMIAAMAFLVLSGCINENRQKIVGSWAMVKADKLAQRVSVAPEPQENDQNEASESKSAIPTPDEAGLPLSLIHISEPTRPY